MTTKPMITVADFATREFLLPNLIKQLRTSYPEVADYTDAEVEQYWLTGLLKASIPTLTGDFHD